MPIHPTSAISGLILQAMTLRYVFARRKITEIARNFNWKKYKVSQRDIVIMKLAYIATCAVGLLASIFVFGEGVHFGDHSGMSRALVAGDVLFVSVMVYASLKD
jgi:hypothetical protein